MIYILHGDDVSKSRALILNHQKKLAGAAKTEISIAEVTPQQLLELCASASLFGENPFVVLDISNQGKTNVAAHVDILKKIKDECVLIIFANKSLGKTNAFISNAQKLGAKVIESQKFIDANVFRFVDALFSKNRTGTYRELNKLYAQGYDSFYVFSMIQYGLRNIAKVMWKSPSSSKLKPFQISKLLEQSQKFGKAKISSFFTHLYQLEKKAKTGVVQPEYMITLTVEKMLNS